MRIALILLLACKIIPTWSQNVVQTTDRKQDVVHRINEGLSSNDIINGVPPEIGNITGSGYLEEDWQPAYIQFYSSDKVYKIDFLKYDIYHNLFEYKDNEGVKVIYGHYVRNFKLESAIQNREFINAAEYGSPENKITGFLEILVDNSASLFCHYSAIIKKNNYNVALDVGDKNDKILVKKDYLLGIDNDFLKKIKTRKDLERHKPASNQLLKTFIKNNQIRFNQKSDLVELIKYYNSI